MKKQAITILEHVLHDALVDLFGYYSSSPPEVSSLDDSQTVQWLAEQMADTATTKKMVSSSIGIGSEDFRASVGILADVSTTIALCETDQACPVDWTGELVNQLIGRVKNQLAEYGVNTMLSMPMSMTGVSMGFNFASTNQQVFAIGTSEGRIICVLNSEVEPTLEWERAAGLKAAAEGSLCLF